MAYGPGDISPNDYAFSYNSFWTNWDNSAPSTGSLCRVTNLYCRWGADSGTTTGHNDTWEGGSLNRAAYSTDFSVGVNTYGSYNVAGPASTFWLNNATYYGGFWRPNNQNSRTPFRDGSGAGYSGKSADDADISSGTNNWAGVGNPGGLGWSVAVQNSALYIRRSGGWTQVPYFYANRGGGNNWTVAIVYVNRGGGGNWQICNRYLEQSERHLPEAGLPVMVDIGDGWERGWLVEGDEGWFGSEDPESLKIDDPLLAPYTGRHNALDTPEMIEKRLEDKYLLVRSRQEGRIIGHKEKKIFTFGAPSGNKILIARS